MTLFRKRSNAPYIAAFIGGGIVTLAAAAYGVAQWLKASNVVEDDEVTDFSDPYIPAHPRPGSRKAVHATV